VRSIERGAACGRTVLACNALFPRLPPDRLREIAPKVVAICELYGVQYSRKTWGGGSLLAALRRLGRMSLPPALAVG
jgi:hypothetical protein